MARELSCALDELRGINGDNPYLIDGRALGFTTYVCEHVPDLARTEFPISSVLD